MTMLPIGNNNASYLDSSGEEGYKARLERVERELEDKRRKLMEYDDLFDKFRLMQQVTNLQRQLSEKEEQQQVELDRLRHADEIDEPGRSLLADFLNNCNVDDAARCYSVRSLSVCRELYLKSPRAYAILLRSGLPVPSKSFLKSSHNQSENSTSAAAAATDMLGIQGLQNACLGRPKGPKRKLTEDQSDLLERLDLEHAGLSRGKLAKLFAERSGVSLTPLTVSRYLCGGQGGSKASSETAARPHPASSSRQSSAKSKCSAESGELNRELVADEVEVIRRIRAENPSATIEQLAEIVQCEAGTLVSADNIRRHLRVSRKGPPPKIDEDSLDLLRSMRKEYPDKSYECLSKLFEERSGISVSTMTIWKHLNDAQPEQKQDQVATSSSAATVKSGARRKSRGGLLPPEAQLFLKSIREENPTLSYEKIAEKFEEASAVKLSWNTVRRYLQQMGDVASGRSAGSKSFPVGANGAGGSAAKRSEPPSMAPPGPDRLTSFAVSHQHPSRHDISRDISRPTSNGLDTPIDESREEFHAAMPNYPGETYIPIDDDDTINRLAPSLTRMPDHSHAFGLVTAPAVVNGGGTSCSQLSFAADRGGVVSASAAAEAARTVHQAQQAAAAHMFAAANLTGFTADAAEAAIQQMHNFKMVGHPLSIAAAAAGGTTLHPNNAVALARESGSPVNVNTSPNESPAAAVFRYYSAGFPN